MVRRERSGDKPCPEAARYMTENYSVAWFLSFCSERIGELEKSLVKPCL
jgi:hypothetical protein